MPFAVFRRHQRKMLAVIAILAMFGFVLSDSLYRLVMPRGGAAADEVIARLYGRPIYRSEVEAMRTERARANLFLARVQMELNPAMPPRTTIFGDTSTRDIVDALILKHEADALGMPASPEMARRWLKTVTNDRFTPAMGDRIVAQNFKSQLVSGQQILAELADQIRLLNVRRLPGLAAATPLDVFRAYRDQNERVVVHALPVHVDDFVDKVPAPTDAEIRAFYDRYKDATPDPARPTPGFTTPRRVRLEFLALDAAALEPQFRARLTEKELRDAFEERKAELNKPSPMDELPLDLFAGDPEARLTPRTFAEARPALETELVEAKVQDELKRRFDPARDAMSEFSNAYQEAAQPPGDDDEPRKDAPAPPTPLKLKELAAKLGLTYEKTPLLTREELARYGDLSRSRVGLSQGGRGRSIATEFFDPKTDVFTSYDLADGLGRYYLAWKVEDLPPRTPKLDEIRPEVVAAWKREQARRPAQEAARQLADAARKHDGDLGAVAQGRRVIVTDPISKVVFSPREGLRLGEIRQIPDAGDALRDAIFRLGDKAVAVEPDQPQSTYYVLTIARREPVSFRELYAPFSERPSLEMRAFQEANLRRSDSWMADLRKQAGLPTDWAPPHEPERRGSRAPDEPDDAI